MRARFAKPRICWSHGREQRVPVLLDRRAQVFRERGPTVCERQRHQGVEHRVEMPLHRTGRRRVPIVVGMVVSASDHRAGGMRCTYARSAVKSLVV